METATGALWRRRLQDLARSVGKPHEPMFAPLLLGVAAQIDAISVPEMVSDATRLRKNAAELRRMLGLAAVTCAVPSLMEMEALGGMVNSGVWPPVQQMGGRMSLSAFPVDAEALMASVRLAASVDAVRQLASADISEPVIAVALTGPATLVSQLRSVVFDDESADSLYDLAGRLLAVLVRLYCEAGAHVVQLHESVDRCALTGEEVDLWKGALGTAGNVARFHRVPPVLVMPNPIAMPWPAQAVPCEAPSDARMLATRPHGLCWSDDPAAWPQLPTQAGQVRLITTGADVPFALPLGDLLGQVQRVREAH